jgi:glycine cleavage system H protein
VKELDELKYGENLLYSKDHEWITREGATLKVGISDYAQDQMGDVVFVEFPEIGDKFQQGETFGTVESVKAVSELYIPVSGEIISVNEALGDAPELINEDPYGSWIIEIKPDDIGELANLIDTQAYQQILKG